MTCHRYKHALLQLASAGVETKPDSKLHAHLQTCSSCRSAFENERSLFASIDSCLRSSANSELPSSFIPTVRARFQQEDQHEIQQQSSTTRGSGCLTDRLVWASAFAAAAILLFIFTRLDLRLKPQPTEGPLVTQQAQSPVAPQTTATEPLQVADPQIAPATRKRFAVKTATTLNKHSVLTGRREPEILVPPDQEILLARYADRWRRRHQSPPILLTAMEPTQTDPLQVPLIQIAELDIKPLAPLAPDQKNDQEYDQKYDQK
jgi:hypothetical protein